MKTKILLSSVLIAILPLVANADYTVQGVSTPTKVSNGGIVKMTNHGGPFVTAQILPGDETQVVAASYVKGAYNDTIAALNKYQIIVDGKQNRLQSFDGDGGVIDGDSMSAEEFVDGIAEDNLEDMTTLFLTAYGVAAGIRSQRVTAVDTWGSPHTVDVAFKTVQ